MLANLIGNVVSAGMSLFGGAKQRKAQEKANAQNAALQREFAQNSISWRVADAKRAGIHPVFAMGASPAQASPSFVAGDHSDMSRAGQNIGRAISGGVSRGTRAAAQYQALQMERAGLENELLRAQIATQRQQNVSRVGEATSGDVYLMDGQPDSGPTVVKNVPRLRHFSHPIHKHLERAVVPEVAHVRTKSGYAPVVTKHAKEGMDDMFLPQLHWMIRNNILPSFGANYSPPVAPPGKGKEWWYNPLTGEYTRFRKKKAWDHLRR
jgi:hypothetical protein